jgi:hypothetical protein
MPIHVSETKTRSGFAVLRVEFEKEVTVSDAEGFMDQVGDGTKHERTPYVVTGNIISVSPEVKHALVPRGKPKNPPPIAVVLPSAVARMVAGLMMRLSGDVESEYFKNEADALAWLDTAAAEFAKKITNSP